jgi:UTP-glucose-1-phosphate uridylyltransferase
MAAGMGSRFGGLKQVEAVGPHGATLLDYSIYDALKAGFGKVVFIIRHDFEDVFREKIGRKWEPKVPISYVFQEMDLLPGGHKMPTGRTKPWGTSHAIWAAKEQVNEPFAALNADDYYGPNAFRILADHLSKNVRLDQPDYALVGYNLFNTLSDYGPVTRGVCEMRKDGLLHRVVERMKIEKDGAKARAIEADGIVPLEGTETASMNLWGFTPYLFKQLDKGFREFLAARGQEEKSEYLIPRSVDTFLQSGEAKVNVLPTDDPWFGITFPQDLPMVKGRIAELVAQGVYPELLWA